MGVFSNFLKDLHEPKVNKGLIEYFNQQINQTNQEDLFTYVSLDNNNNQYILRSQEAIEFDVENFEIPQKFIDKGIKTSQDLQKYIYNSQQPIDFPLTRMRSGNQEIDPKKILLNPLEENPYPVKEIDKIRLIPNEFPPSRKVSFTFGNSTEDFEIERQAYDDLNKVYFKSTDDKPLTINMFFDESEEQASLTISFKIMNSHSIEEALKYSKYHDEFFKGNLKIDNIELSGTMSTTSPPSTTPFLQLLFELEHTLKTKLGQDLYFNPQMNLGEEKYILAHQLYYSLCLKKAFKSNNILNNIEILKETADPDFIKALQNHKQSDNSYSFFSDRTEILNLLGAEIKINIKENYHSIKIVGIEETSDKYIVTIKSSDSGFTSGLYYLDENDDFSLDTEIISKLMNAEEIYFK